MCITNTSKLAGTCSPWHMVCNHDPWRSANQTAWKTDMQVGTVRSHGSSDNWTFVLFLSSWVTLPLLAKNKDIGWNQVTPRILFHTSRAELETTRLISWQQILSRLPPPYQHGRDKSPITPPKQDVKLLRVSCVLPVFSDYEMASR